MNKRVIKLGATKARKDFSELVDVVYAMSERVVLLRNGKKVAAIVSIEDLHTLERLEDEQDKALVRQRLKDDAEPISWEDAKKKLGW